MASASVHVASGAPIVGAPAAGAPDVGAAGERLAPESERERTRQRFLEQSAITLGRVWAERWREDLHGEGRPAAGGWPGTLPEARGRVSQGIPTEMARKKMPALTAAERERAARTAYASARSEWRTHLEPESPLTVDPGWIAFPTSDPVDMAGDLLSVAVGPRARRPRPRT